MNFRTTLWVMLFFSFIPYYSQCYAQSKPSKKYVERYKTIMDRTQWWRDARFGMFIHFGAYAVPARGEWVKSTEKMSTEEYQKYVDVFNPEDYDAKKWARAAKDAGMKYAVLTAKHHDGFALFDSKYTDYKISKNMQGRDLVREFLDAFRAEGIKVGLYYSIIDWHHPDYPNVGNHPMRDNKEYSKKKYNWNNYLKYMHNQVEELVTNYGNLDIMWFDYSFDDYQGEKWKATELVEMVRKHQPDIILDNRLEVNSHTNTKGLKLPVYGDFVTPEQAIPDEPLKDIYGNNLPWETCLTLNNNWGFHANDHSWKSPEMIVEALVNCVSKDGNLLLNVGPDGRGNIPEQSLAILEEVGEWVKRNGESIYGNGSTELPKPDWGRFTKKNNIIYAHWMYPNIGPVNVRLADNKIKSLTVLADGTEAYKTAKWWGNESEGNLFINVSQPIHMTYNLPDPINTVIKIVLKEEQITSNGK
jgi:alpha-L-fucosidase